MKTLKWLPLLALAGCAGISGQLFQTLIGQHLSVGFPAAVAFPDEITMNLTKPDGDASQAEQLGKSVFGTVMGMTVEQKVGQAVKKAGLPVRQITAAAFRKELEKAALFGSVNEGKGDVMLDLGVARWGLEYDSYQKKIVPVLDLEAGLSFAGFGKVWTGRKSAADLGTAVADKARNLDFAALLSRPKDLSSIYEIMAADLSRQLVDEMRTRPPRVLAAK